MTEDTYRVRRQRVDRAYDAFRTTLARPHSPADARCAARELEAALHAATRAAVAGVGSASDPAGWRAELTRLAALSHEVRITTLGDLGLEVPTTVRVGSRAATAPHIPGLAFEPADLVAQTLLDPRIGVTLTEAVDTAFAAPDRAAPAEAVAPAVSAPSAA